MSPPQVFPLKTTSLYCHAGSIQWAQGGACQALGRRCTARSSLAQAEARGPSSGCCRCTGALPELTSTFLANARA